MKRPDFSTSPPKDLIEIKDPNFVFRYNYHFPSFILKENEVKNVLNLVNENGFCRFLTQGENIIGMLVADKSHFDSDLFGFGVGKINFIRFSDNLDEAVSLQIFLVQKCLSWIKQNDLKCVIARVNPSDSIAFEKNGFYLVDTLLTFHLEIASIDSNNNSCLIKKIKIREFEDQDETKIVDIGRNAFSHDHFHRDKKFPKERSDELHARWVSNCCNGRADCVLVASVSNGMPIGFITCKLGLLDESKQGIIDLVAVSAEHKRKGIGQYLVLEAVRWFTNNGAQSVIVSTQADNVAAVSTYMKIGFKLVRKQFTFHKWMDD